MDAARGRTCCILIFASVRYALPLFRRFHRICPRGRESIAITHGVRLKRTTVARRAVIRIHRFHRILFSDLSDRRKPRYDTTWNLKAMTERHDR